MKQFKEWLSDYLRYFLLLLAAILAFFLILAGVKIYQNSKKPDAANAIQIITETETETTEKKQTETKMTSETESETEPESEQLVVAIDPGHQGNWVDMSEKEPNGPGSSEMKAKAT